ncbi:MAG TPA: NAD(P)/FAD-dependent oxidoreductase [Bryobacteraceae bacterium]|nr:NAD(P)/FAD-dependent oxidoreductase [Bryobacteraceae bacterium]
MTSCDVLIVGGGPAGSSCAWALRASGLDIALIDRQTFPRDKVCGGWITPRVLEALQIDPADYRSGVMQPITSFRTGYIGGNSPCDTDFGKPVSYGIRRLEFDGFLLRRAADGERVRLREGVPLASLERSGEWWIANENLRARLVVGAGGHFCPVARYLTGKHSEAPVVAQETEFEMDAQQQAACRVRATCPELYFCSDMKGYGWCFRKGNVLNVGLGRADSRSLREHVTGFVRFLHERAEVPAYLPPLRGHAYLLQGTSPRAIAGDGFLLVGDSAGLACPLSGEGILPAIESGLLAAETILAAKGDYSAARLEPYREQIEPKLRGASHDWLSAMAGHLPARLIGLAARPLTETGWFAREFILRRWFLHA